MKFPTRFFVICLVMAGISLAGGYLYAGYLGRQLSKAVSACETESKREVSDAKHALPESVTTGSVDGIPRDAVKFDGLVCDPIALAEAVDVNGAKPPPGTQERVLLAYRKVLSSETDEGGELFAAVFIAIGLIPTFWYFFLARLREVAAAIRGG